MRDEREETLIRWGRATLLACAVALALALLGCSGPTLCSPPPVRGTRADAYGDGARTVVMVAACWKTRGEAR